MSERSDNSLEPTSGISPDDELPLDESGRTPLSEPVDDDEEEIPRAVMIAIIAIVLIATVLYMSIGGGHHHFH